MPVNQTNIFSTAEGRVDPNQNTGISILNCKVTAAADLIPVKSSFKTYLGRPWKEYSRTVNVFLESYIDDLVDPAGWLEWNGTFALSTLYYGEYMNLGPGSNTSARVKWPGYRVITHQQLNRGKQFYSGGVYTRKRVAEFYKYSLPCQFQLKQQMKPPLFGLGKV
jgi:hypothetical protein